MVWTRKFSFNQIYNTISPRSTRSTGTESKKLLPPLLSIFPFSFSFERLPCRQAITPSTDKQTLFTWLWLSWLPLRLSKRQSATTVLYRTTLSRDPLYLSSISVLNPRSRSSLIYSCWWSTQERNNPADVSSFSHVQLILISQSSLMFFIYKMYSVPQPKEVKSNVTKLNRTLIFLVHREPLVRTSVWASRH